MEKDFNIVVIGSGPGGYSAAIRASQLGYRVAIIEKYATLGGTCTNVGCIPTKALLDSTENFYAASTKFESQGIRIENLSLDFNKLLSRKNDVVSQNTAGIVYLMKKNKIKVFQGIASFNNKQEVNLLGPDGTNSKITSDYFIIATGSKPSTLPGISIDKKRIITSTEALALNEKPRSLVIIGGGVIGVEMASIYSRIGTRVTIIEFADSLIPSMDKELGKELKKILSKSGIEILLSSKVQSVENKGNSTLTNYIDANNTLQEIEADYCLVAVGRKPNTKDLSLQNTRITLDSKSRIETDDQLRTGEENIFAIGDVIKGPMLAHKAEEEGVFVAEIINGQKPQLHYNLIPSVVYSWPEVASVGETEEQLKEKGIEYRVGKFPFSASGRARASGDKDGFSKVLTGVKYGEVLGVHIIGPRAADLIAQAVIGIHYETTDEDMFRFTYAHPTYSETLKEAYKMASGQGSLNI